MRRKPKEHLDPEAREARRRKRLLGLARALMIYGLLLGGSVVFAMPFVWMLGTSFKVDREMFGEKITILPMAPLPAEASPYLDARYYRPDDIPGYRVALMVIEQLIAEEGVVLPDDVRNENQVFEILAPGVYDRLKRQLPETIWALHPVKMREELEGKVTRELIDDVTRKVYRHLSLGPVRVRSYDLQEEDVVGDMPVAEFWELESPVPAWLSNQADASNPYADLVYAWGDNKGAKIVLSHTLELPFEVDRLYRTQLYVRPDDSWHRLEFFMEKDGKLYKGKRPEFMGNFQWSVITLQDYGPDDESTKIRLWIPMEEVDEAPEYERNPRKVKLIVVLERSNLLEAWWGKCQRNYRGALNYIPFWRYTATSAFLVILNIIGTIFSCSLVAYAFARLQWPGRTISFGLMMATLMIPPQITMIPYFLIIKHLGWYNTLKPLWVMSFFANAFNVFLLRQFMKGIPRDLEDAARIDGCNFLQVYWYVIMPLIKPTLACISIFTFMGVWNDFMGPLIYLSDQRLYPLSLGLYAFNVQAGGSFGMMMAGSFLMTLPVIIVFFFAQKYFIQGVTLTGMKG